MPHISAIVSFLNRDDWPLHIATLNIKMMVDFCRKEFMSPILILFLKISWDIHKMLKPHGVMVIFGFNKCICKFVNNKTILNRRESIAKLEIFLQIQYLVTQYFLEHAQIKYLATIKSYLMCNYVNLVSFKCLKRLLYISIIHKIAFHS